MTRGRRPGVLFTYMDVVHGQEVEVTRYESIMPDEARSSVIKFKSTNYNPDRIISDVTKYDTYEALSDLRLLQRIVFKDKKNESV